MRGRPLLFGGTSEGRYLAQRLSDGGVEVLLCVATDYGREVVAESPLLEVHTGRLDREGMAALIREEGADLVVDATHPYAREASEHIRAACELCGVERIRVVRPAGEHRGVITVPDMAAAARELSNLEGRALLTVGSKELAAFTAVPDYRERLVARVLPDPAVMAACHALGFGGKNLIAMQGPFSRELNAAMLRQMGARWLVTKDSGGPGGLEEKLAGARDVGAEVLLVGRPIREEGLSLEEAVAVLCRRFGFPPREEPEQEGYFPLFVPLRDRVVLLAGGGAVALRRVRSLRDSGARLRVVAPELHPELKQLADDGAVEWLREEYHARHLEKAALVVAATNRREVNRRIGLDARARGIPVSVADRRGECTAIFPAIARAGSLTAGIVSQAGDHGAVRRAAALFRETLDQTLGE